ncbi:MAG: DUF1631 family protein [Pseudomonadota bacterium]
MLTAQVIDKLVAATTDRDGELYGQMALQLLEPLHERLAFAEPLAKDAELRPAVERLIEASANLTILDSRVLADDHPFGATLEALGRFVSDRPGEEKEQTAWRRHLEGMVAQLADLDSASDAVLKKIGQDCDGFQKRQRRRAEIAKKRAAQAEAARGRLDDSRVAADRIIANMIERLAPPPPIAELLSGPWQNVIVLECVRHGQDAMATTRAIRTAQDLTKWSSGSKDLPGKLRARLVEGLGMVGFTEEEGHRFLDELVVAVRPATEASSPAAPEPAAPPDEPTATAQASEAPPAEPTPTAPAQAPKPLPAEPTPAAQSPEPLPAQPKPTAQAAKPRSPEPAPAQRPAPPSTPAAASPTEKPAKRNPSRRAPPGRPAPEPAEAKPTASAPKPVRAPEPAPETVPAAASAAAETETAAPEIAEELPPAKPYLNVPAETPAPPPEAPADPSWNIGGVEVRKGDWFEFVREGGDKVRAKLSWVSPISRNLLFVDDRGIKVADMNFDELRANFAAREARLVRETA